MKVDLKAFGQNATPDSTSDYRDLEYKNGGMYSISHWDNKVSTNQLISDYPRRANLENAI